MEESPRYAPQTSPFHTDIASTPPASPLPDMYSSRFTSAAPTLLEEPLPDSDLEKDIDEKDRDFEKSQDPPVDDSDPETLLVDWDGPDDPLNPKNWPRKQKWGATFMVSTFTFITPVASSMIAPASDQVAAEFGITSTVMIALLTSIFLLAFAVGPLFLGPLSELYGRRRVTQYSNLFFLAWNLGCGFTQNQTQLLVCRFFAGLGGSAPLAIGGGVIADTWAAEERGHAISIYSLAPLLGPVVGPVCGAWIAEKSNWRWVFWSTTIVDAAIQVVGYFCLQETFAPFILSQKAKAIMRTLDTEKGPIKYVKTPYDANWNFKYLIHKTLIRPFSLFIHEPIVQIMALFLAFVYGLLYLFLTNMTTIFVGVYHQSVGIAGLHYLALGFGQACSAQMNARFLDRIYIYFKNKNGGVGQPEFRLPSMIPGTFLLPIGLLITGWAVQYRVHWIVADIGIYLVGAGINLSFQSVQLYVVDTFTLHAASALAVVACLRALAGFGFPLFAPPMYNALGFGKGNTILACVGIAIGCPAPWLFWRYGKRIRLASKYANHVN